MTEKVDLGQSGRQGKGKEKETRFSLFIQVPDAAVTAILNHSCLPHLQLPMRCHNASSGVTSWTPCPLTLPRSEDYAPPASEEGAPAGSISTSPSSSLFSATVCARVLV